MKENPLPENLLERIVDRLDLDSDAIHPRVAAALREGRLRAVETVKHPLLLGLPRWVTVSGLATTAVIAVLAFSFWPRHPTPATNSIAAEDLEVITSAEQIDLYRDLDFYQWLDRRDNGR